MGDGAHQRIRFRPGADEEIAEEAMAPDEAFDLQALFDVLARRWRLIFASLIVGSTLAVLAALALPKTYEASAELLLRPPVQTIVDVNTFEDGQTGESAFLESQIAILRSDLLMANAAARLSRDGTAPALDDLSEREAAETLARQTSVNRIGQSYVIRIAGRARDGDAAAAIANAVADVYIADEVSWRLQSVQRTNVWLEGQLQTLGETLAASESAVEAYRARYGLGDINGATLSDRQRADLNAALADARAELAEKQARYDRIAGVRAAGGDLEALPQVQASPAMADYRRQQAALRGRLAELSTRYGEAHPTMINLRSEIADLQRLIQAEVDRTIAKERTEADIQRARVEALESELAGLESSSADLGDARIELRRLERVAEADRKVYENFLDGYKRTVLLNSADAITAEARKITAASAPARPASPDLALFSAAGLIISAIFSCFLVYALEFMSRGFLSGEAAAKALRAPLLAVLPKSKHIGAEGASLPHYLIDTPVSAFSEGVRRLRASLQIRAQTPPRIVAVASALPQEGKTVTAASYALSAQLAGAKTVLVDCDLRRPSLAGLFRGAPNICVTDVLKGEAALQDAIYQDPTSGLHLLLCRATSEQSADLLGSDAMIQLLTALRETYDLVVLDTAPVVPLIDAALIAKAADATVFCVRQEKTSRDAASTAVKMLRDYGARVSGVALTIADLSRTGAYQKQSAYQSYYRERRLPAE